MLSQRSERSLAPIEREHLDRLAALADIQHAQFVREGARAHSWENRRVAVVLAQGGALHYLDGVTGVKDFDIWTFYAAIPGMPLRCGRYETHADFGPSVHGRQQYPTDFKHPQKATWLSYQGRRVDFMVRDLPVAVGATTDETTHALRVWLANGANDRSSRKSSSWHLSCKAMIWVAPAEPGAPIWPDPERGRRRRPSAHAAPSGYRALSGRSSSGW